LEKLLWNKCLQRTCKNKERREKKDCKRFTEYQGKKSNKNQKYYERKGTRSSNNYGRHGKEQEIKNQKWWTSWKVRNKERRTCRFVWQERKECTGYEGGNSVTSHTIRVDSEREKGRFKWGGGVFLILWKQEERTPKGRRGYVDVS